MVVGIPVLIGLIRHAGLVAPEGVLHVHVDRFAIALQLPVARHGYLVPSTHVKVLTIEISWARLGIFRPMEQPLTVERNDFLTLLLFRRQLQRGVIW